MRDALEMVLMILAYFSGPLLIIVAISFGFSGSWWVMPLMVVLSTPVVFWLVGLLTNRRGEE